ncbi:MAG: efflux RND transporter periplasmic adaptor subunit [Rikenellaceae bacterium]
MNRKSFIAAALSATILFATSCGVSEAPQKQATKYDLISIESSTFSVSSSYSAAVRGKQDISIVPQVSGYLAEIKVTEGATVTKGDVLFVIEQSPYQAAYQAAKASVDMAKAGVATAKLNYKNSLSLNKKGIISDSELQSTKNSLSSAEAQLSLAIAQEASAKVNLDFTVIKSPSNGVVGKLPYRQGTLVSASSAQPLTVVSDNSQMYVYFSMNENQIYNLLDTYGSIDKAIAAMSDLELKLSNGTVYQHKGELESISGVIDSTTGAVSLRAMFDNPERRLLSGTTASVIIPENYDNAIVIPKAATFDLQDKIFVYRVVDGVAKSTPIEVSKSMSSTEYIVTSGLNLGEVIIASGAGLVRDGAAVMQ